MTVALQQHADQRRRRRRRPGSPAAGRTSPAPGKWLLEEASARRRWCRRPGQHLAVGHVDDAHQAEGDGQAQRGEQEHAGQRQAVQQAADDADQPLAALDRAASARGGRRARRSSVSTELPSGALASALHSKLVRWPLLPIERPARRAARRRLGAGADRRGPGPAPAPPCTPASLLAGQRPVQQGARASADRSGTAPRPPPAAPPGRARQLQLGHAPAVIDPADRRCPSRPSRSGRRRGRRPAPRSAGAGSVAGLRVDQKTRPSAADPQAVVVQRLQRAAARADRRRARPGPTMALLDRLDVGGPRPRSSRRRARPARGRADGAAEQRRRRPSDARASQRPCARAPCVGWVGCGYLACWRQRLGGRGELRLGAVAADPRDRSSRRPSWRCRG